MKQREHLSDAAVKGRWIQRIRRDTEFLRTTDNPVYRRIRTLLVECGIDPQAILVANIMREDASVESGFLVTDDKRVYEFEFDWRGRPTESGVLAVWRDLTDTYHTRAFREPIAVALTMTSAQASPVVAAAQSSLT